MYLTKKQTIVHRTIADTRRVHGGRGTLTVAPFLSLHTRSVAEWNGTPPRFEVN